MLSIVNSGSLRGIEIVDITIEVNSGEKGDPRFVIVGLPDAAVKESHDRVFSALSNSGFICPRTRTTVNLAPGYIRKEGSFYDLPIALGVLQSTGQANMRFIDDFIIAGELSLSGRVSNIKGGIAFGMYAKRRGKKLILPQRSAREAALVDDIEVFEADSLRNVVSFLSGAGSLSRAHSSFNELSSIKVTYDIDFSDIIGQGFLKRAVEVAVAGGHNLLMLGPPGSGKSMIAKRIPTIMPDPNKEELLDIINIYSAAGVNIEDDVWTITRPFRSPHHTISNVGLLGGGTFPRPGEISLAHHGVLFLDELSEYNKVTLEALRQPLEDGEITISRSAGKITLPCCIMCVAAMNPCPCGFLGDKTGRCKCSAEKIRRYRSKISGPLLDRFDIQVDVQAVSVEDMQTIKRSETSAIIKERVEHARARQLKRFASGIIRNADMKSVNEVCKINMESQALLNSAMKNLHLSVRAHNKILRVARTIADLAGEEMINDTHILEAIQYRTLDRNFF